MPDGFDPELLLRLAGERAVLDPQREAGFPWGIRLAVMASALCAVGVIDETAARQIVGDYRIALALRGHHNGYVLLPEITDDRYLTVELQPEPTADCSGRLDLGHVGTVITHYVVFSGERARIEMDVVGSDQLPRTELKISDDRGNQTIGNLSCSGHAAAWRGQIVTKDPLDPDTKGLRLDGTSLAVSHRPSIAARLEPLPPESSSEQHLRLKVAAAVAGHGWFHGLSDNLEAAYSALFSAGMIDADSAVLAELRAVAATFPLFPDQPPPRPDLPNPWRSLVERRKAGPGPEGAAAIGVLTEPIDGVRVRLDGIVSRADDFEVRVATSPAIDMSHAHELDPAPRPRIIWWARDDLDGYYLGRMGNVWTAGQGIGTGALRFWPSLNPNARSLLLLPTGSRSRAVVGPVPLSWDSR